MTVPTKTARRLAAQGIRAAVARQTLTQSERRRLQENPDNVEVIEQVLAEYEARMPLHRGHGDIPLGLRRVIGLLTGERRK